jgi:hypothetical protein
MVVSLCYHESLSITVNEYAILMIEQPSDSLRRKKKRTMYPILRLEHNRIAPARPETSNDYLGTHTFLPTED